MTRGEPIFPIRGCGEYLSDEVFDYSNGMFAADSILVHVCEETFRTYYNDDVNKPGGKYVPGIGFPDPITSEMITPISHENEILGVIDLYSYKKAFFNPFIVHLVERSMKLFISSYMAKKRYHVYNNLIKPAEAWTDQREIYRQLIRLLTEYYYTDTICVWVRDTADPQRYNLVEAFPENREFIGSLVRVISESKVVSEDFVNKLGPEIDLLYDFTKPNSINKFCIENDFIFYISTSIKILNRYEVFINIFSRLDIFQRKPDAEEKERQKTRFLSRDFEFLSQVTTKVSVSLQNLRITKALRDMSAAISYEADQQYDTLQNIVRSAQIATGADIVALFPFYAEQQEIRKMDGIISNGMINKSEKRAIFADLIFRSGKDQKVYNFDSNEECKAFVLSHDPKADLSEFDSKGFRTVNKIISTSAMRLVFGSIPVGVMFFNYRQYQHLEENDTLQQINLFFSTFSGYQLFVNKELNSYQGAKQGAGREICGVKTEELEKMIPLITRTQILSYCRRSEPYHEERAGWYSAGSQDHRKAPGSRQSYL